MLGLIEKDLRLTLVRKQTFLVFIVVALVMGMSMDGTFVVGYLTMLAMILAVGTISYDEFDNGFAFLMTLPFARKTYVKEKYLFCFLMSVAAWCVGIVLYYILGLIRGSGAAPLEELPMLITLIPVLYLTSAIMIPLQLKYGSEKSRIVLFILFGLIAVLIIVGKQALDGASFLTGLVQVLNRTSPTIILAVLAAVGIVAAFISYLCSVRILENKEL